MAIQQLQLDDSNFNEIREKLEKERREQALKILK